MITTGSLQARLIAAASLAVAAALYASGLVLSQLFSGHVAARLDAELLVHSNQIIANLELGPQGAVTLTVPPADPRFELPNGGLYWQLDLPGGTRLRSRSLWENVLTLPSDDMADASVHRHELPGPGGHATRGAGARASRLSARGGHENHARQVAVDIARKWIRPPLVSTPY